MLVLATVMLCGVLEYQPIPAIQVQPFTVNRSDTSSKSAVRAAQIPESVLVLLQQDIRAELSKHAYQTDPVNSATMLTLSGHVTDFSLGGKTMRYIIPGSNAEVLAVEVTITDPSGKVLYADKFKDTYNLAWGQSNDPSHVTKGMAKKIRKFVEKRVGEPKK